VPEVLVVEDHPLVAEATAALLKRIEPSSEVVNCASAVDALRLLDNSGGRWSRIFLDLSVPGAYGLSLAMDVQARGLAAICCVVSAFDRSDFIAEVRRLGFLGYIVKAASVAELTVALSTAMSGQQTYPTPRATGASNPRLTRRQTEILELVRAGLPSKRIARRLGLVEGTVNNQVAAILQVLHAESRTHAVARAIELGVLPMTPHGDPTRTLATHFEGHSP